jgi:hypothetical protein
MCDDNNNYRHKQKVHDIETKYFCDKYVSKSKKIENNIYTIHSSNLQNITQFLKIPLWLVAKFEKILLWTRASVVTSQNWEKNLGYKAW